MGDTEEKKKVHLVNWKKVCKPKREGGLGLRSCNNNLANIAKLGWNLVKGNNCLWTSVLKHKFSLSTKPRLWKHEKCLLCVEKYYEGQRPPYERVEMTYW